MPNESPDPIVAASTPAVHSVVIDSEQIRRHCIRLQQQLSADASDLRQSCGPISASADLRDGAVRLDRLLSNVNDLLGQLASAEATGEHGGDLERNEH